MYLDTIHINNLRCFKNAEFKLHYPGRNGNALPKVSCNNINLLLGNNGSGKSTVLRAIALSALAPIIQNSGYVPYSLVRKTKKEDAPNASVSGDFILHPQDLGKSGKRNKTEVITSSIKVERLKDFERLRVEDTDSTLWEHMYRDDSPAFLMLGYSASRRVETAANVDLSLRNKSRLLRYQRVSGLFEEHVTLIPLSVWLPNLKTKDPGRYRQVTNLINRLLPKSTRFTGYLSNGNYLFSHKGVKVSFEAMSDGYRSYIGWIADLLYHVCMGCPSGAKLVDNRGIVLLDEVDLHLHPEWQREVVPVISKELPNLQFVLTTHSPIIVGTLEQGNIWLMEESEKGSGPLQMETEVHGLNADQVLTSDAFGLTTSRAGAFVEKMRKVSEELQSGDHMKNVLLSNMIIKGAAALKGPQSTLNKAEPWTAKSAKVLKELNLNLVENTKKNNGQKPSRIKSKKK